MCGIAGFWTPPTMAREEMAARARAMGERLRLRGPDGGEVWVDADAGVGLAHRRLAIVDLSPAGLQPMVSASGRFVIVFNGEIYNHGELREAQPGIQWRGHSDTEALLEAIDRWGIEAALKRSVGMFAIALWDREERTLTLARDRMGEKPLYYGWQGETLLFGSELKALQTWPGFAPAIDRGAIALLLRHNYIPAPHSIFSGVFKLPPGHTLTLCGSGAPAGGPRPRAYWSMNEVVRNGAKSPWRGSDDDAVNELESRLVDAVRLQRVADVPLGAFLSGGVDSSTIVALMQRDATRPVRTFTIGFHEAGFNEAEHAKAVAAHLGTDHTEAYISAEQALQVVPRLPQLYCEPFADSSQIPTFLLAQLARQQVTVSLSGDAGDELFNGYDRYQIVERMRAVIDLPPPAVRRAVGAALDAVPAWLWSGIGSVRGGRWAAGGLAARVHTLARWLRSGEPENLYRDMISHCADPALLVPGAVEPPTALTKRSAWPRQDDFEARMMFLDAISYLPDDILVKVDRAAMGVSLETRVPLLDHRIVEFAWTLPAKLRRRGNQSKWLLRQVLFRHVPRHLIERPKRGFGIPLDAWLRGPLRPWAEALLTEPLLRQQGYFDVARVRAMWLGHLQSRQSAGSMLWNVLMFQAWLAEQGG